MWLQGLVSQKNSKKHRLEVYSLDSKENADYGDLLDEENQVLIASIYEFTSEKKITLENRAIEGRNK